MNQTLGISSDSKWVRTRETQLVEKDKTWGRVLLWFCCSFVWFCGLFVWVFLTE